MKQYTIYIFVLLVIALCDISFSQDLESKLLRLINKNDLEEVQTNLELVKRKFPDQPIPYYVEAFIERDAEQALELYKNFIERFPHSTYAISAKYKIVQYYFSKESYRTTMGLLKQIITFHSKSSYADDAYYLNICCLIALERFNDAKSEIKRFVKKYPKSPFKKYVLYDLKQLKKFVENKKSKNRSNTASGESSSGLDNNYAIQIGAYRTQKNAQKQVDKISSWGYPVEISTKIVNQKLYYLVWVGKFETRSEAFNFGEAFKRNFGLSFHVVEISIG